MLVSADFLAEFIDDSLFIDENRRHKSTGSGERRSKTARKIAHYEKIVAGRRAKRTDEHRRGRRRRACQSRLASDQEERPLERDPLSLFGNRRELAICVDLAAVAFDRAMSTKELGRLARQLGRVWSCAKRFPHLRITLLCPSSRLVDECRRTITGFDAFTWRLLVEEAGIAETFPLSEIVYLSPDADLPPLLELDSGSVYVIGGLVDESGKGAISRTRAENLGLKCRRLPIVEYLVRGTTGTFNLMLTINQVVEILALFADTGSWRDALGNTVPKRTGYRLL